MANFDLDKFFSKLSSQLESMIEETTDKVEKAVDSKIVSDELIKDIQSFFYDKRFNNIPTNATELVQKLLSTAERLSDMVEHYTSETVAMDMAKRAMWADLDR